MKSGKIRYFVVSADVEIKGWIFEAEESNINGEDVVGGCELIQDTYGLKMSELTEITKEQYDLILDLRSDDEYDKASEIVDEILKG